MKVQVAAVQAVLETLVASDENGLESFGGGPKKKKLKKKVIGSL
jgi:hypothetical protein